MHDILDWLSHHSFLHISLNRWFIAALITVLGYIIVMLVSRITAKQLRKRYAPESRPLMSMMAAALENTRSWLMLVIFAAIGANVLGLKDRPTRLIGYVGAVAAALQVGLWLNRAIRAWVDGKLSIQTEKTRNPVVMAMLAWMMRIMVWATLLLAALNFMGVNITAFVASLGVGGVAVALALQNVLGDLFASMSIGLDKPFELGHFVNFGDISGTIEHVGVKTTRIRSLSGEEVIIGNAQLLSHTVHNYGRMDTRRIVFAFGVTYDTPPERLRELPDVTREIVERNDKVRFDRAHFKKFGDSSLDYEVVYTMLEPDYTLFMDTQQRINFDLVERFAEMDVQFAFPSRTLYVAGTVNTTTRAEGAHDTVPSS
ncbi:mechanosensitive ion channel family protein [Oleiagrimonas sp.]|jgi:small-conductance mechanosensitive channel|uniref:mechanosensitive ion channel family protein n=1 Tax=Oleiagrimonas sp. TaxID=2010330 RepID=UPI0026221CCA|nr:mechanosensitive ion channel family protein [Oleiagrimonas sp.]MDA3914322.1 mechanosensitive ion channel family protein [Oleiagrimonas sp.]